MRGITDRCPGCAPSHPAVPAPSQDSLSGRGAETHASGQGALDDGLESLSDTSDEEPAQLEPKALLKVDTLIAELSWVGGTPGAARLWAAAPAQIHIKAKAPFNKVTFRMEKIAAHEVVRVRVNAAKECPAKYDKFVQRLLAKGRVMHTADWGPSTQRRGRAGGPRRGE